MELRILGPLEAVAEGRIVDIRGQKQRELLVILAIHANEVVSADRLIDELWGESAPASAVKTLQAYVSRLRKTLGSSSLTTHGHGYSLALAPGELDAERFATVLEEGRRALAAGEPDRAAETLDVALALWRGPALADFTYASFAQSEITRLDELRLAAREERVEADLARGRHAEVIGELEQLIARNPLRERPRAQLMLALYRSGRQAEALQAYQEGRRTLAEELGLEPSQALQQLERQILAQDAALTPVVAKRTPERASRRRIVALVVAVSALLMVGIGATVIRATQEDPASRAPAGARGFVGSWAGVDRDGSRQEFEIRSVAGQATYEMTLRDDDATKACGGGAVKGSGVGALEGNELVFKTLRLTCSHGAVLEFGYGLTYRESEDTIVDSDGTIWSRAASASDE